MSDGNSNRNDDSLSAAQVDIDGAKERIKVLEDTINSPDKLAVLVADSAESSSVFRKTLAQTVLSVMDDHDTRVELQKIVRKLDRERLIQVLKYGAAFAIGAATVLGAVFAYVAITPKPDTTASPRVDSQRVTQ